MSEQNSGQAGRRRLLISLGAAAALAGGVGGIVASRREPVVRDRLVVADGRQVSSALFYIALTQGYFAEAGLDVEVQSHSCSRRATEALTNGKVDSRRVLLLQ